LHRHIERGHAAAMHRIGREPRPQHETIRRRIAGRHAERERIVGKTRSREQTRADAGRRDADDARRRVQQAPARVIRRCLYRQPAHTTPAAAPGSGARSMCAACCMRMASPLRRGLCLWKLCYKIYK
jgi:hypothetical protein